MNIKQQVESQQKKPLFSETADIETSSEDYANRFSGKIGRYFLKRQADITLQLLKNFNGRSVLDIGGGHAQLAVPLVNNGYKVTVVGSDDSCRNRLDKFLKKDSFDYQTCDIINLPFKNKMFDIVIAFRLLPHTSNWKKLISEMTRVSSKIVILDYPDIRSFNIFYQFLFNLKKKYEKNTREFRSFSRSEVLTEFGKHNFFKPVIRPEFFFPMVLHRALKFVPFSKFIEGFSQLTRLTTLFGTPVILRVQRME